MGGMRQKNDMEMMGTLQVPATQWGVGHPAKSSLLLSVVLPPAPRENGGGLAFQELCPDVCLLGDGRRGRGGQGSAGIPDLAPQDEHKAAENNLALNQECPLEGSWGREGQ